MKKHFVIQRDLDDLLQEAIPGVIKYTENSVYVEVNPNTQKDLRIARKSAQKGDEKLTPKN